MTELIDINERREEIIRLWNEAFFDSRDYIDFFLNNCPCICAGSIIENKLVSMLFLLDGRIGNFTVKYIYAACTDKAFRGRGLMKELISFSEDYCRKNSDDGLFLVPAEESLYAYYGKLGFFEVFEKKEAVLTPSKNNIKYINSDADKALKIRKELLKDKDCFVFTDEVHKYAISEHLYSGGEILSCSDGDDLSLLFVCRNSEQTVIKEFLSINPVKMFKNIPFFSNNRKENIYIRFPIVYNNTDIGGKGTKCGMCLPLNENFRNYIFHIKSFYAGLYLD